MLSRRSFLAGSVAASAATLVRAETEGPQPTLLRLERRTLEVNGKSASVLSIIRPNGELGITTEVGKPFRVRVENGLSVPSLIHWHGLTPPWRQDGVPEVSAPPIPPGGSADYDFPLTFGGTYWMHSHEGLQEQLLLAAPLIIRSDADRPDEQNIIIMLADFSFTPPEEIYAKLRRGAGMAGMDRAAMKAGKADMAMSDPPSKPDLNDVKYDAFLANDRTLADPEIIKVEPGQTVRLRVINSSAMSAYHIDLGALQGHLIAVDGHSVVPVRGRRFPITISQRLDIRIKIPREAAAYPVLAQLEGERKRSGVILVAGGARIKHVAKLAKEAAPPLTLALEKQLRASDPLQARKADRTHIVNLTGQMEGYVWSINGVPWTSEVPPLPIAEGERVELVFVNKTPMPHPMHLHGHVFQVVAIDDVRFAGPLRDTALIPPKTSVTVAFDANNPGWWALHCHLLYHLAAGMFTTLRYV